MPTYYSNLDTLTEQACKALLVAANINAFAGAESDDKALPCVVVAAEGGEEMPLTSGNFFQQVSVKVSSAAINFTIGLTAHKAFAASVFDVFLTDTIVTDLAAAASNFGVMGFRNRRFLPVRVEDRRWVSEMNIEFLVCATDV